MPMTIPKPHRTPTPATRKRPQEAEAMMAPAPAEEPDEGRDVSLTLGDGRGVLIQPREPDDREASVRYEGEALCLLERGR